MVDTARGSHVSEESERASAAGGHTRGKRGDTELMWPWEHVAFGYLLYSPLLRLATRHGPDGRAALLLAVGAILPDLVDKTLSWWLGVFPTGYALAHSIFVAVPVGLLLLWTRRNTASTAFVAGYWAHLLGDIIDPIRSGGSPDVSRVLWPAVVGEPYEETLGVRRGVVYLREFLLELPTTDLTSPAVLYLLLPLAAVLIWVADGAPGVGLCRRLLTPDRN